MAQKQNPILVIVVIFYGVLNTDYCYAHVLNTACINITFNNQLGSWFIFNINIKCVSHGSTI